MILAGDIGGTKTTLGCFEPRGGALRAVSSATYSSQEHAGLDEIIEKFLARGAPGLLAACFGVAGPVRDGRCAATNLPWVVDERQLASRFALRRVRLINDLEATGWAISTLEPGELATLNEGRRQASGNMGVIAAGTGLGEAGLAWDGERYIPFATEGGHCSFAPGNDLEMELLATMHKEPGHVSVERILSGPGLHLIYRFLRDTGRGQEPGWLSEELASSDPAAAISRAALAGRSPLCAAALDTFVSIYGAEAGNFALKVMATGGLYVAGGIAPKILTRLKNGPFIERFTAKGRMRPLLEGIPVRVVLAEEAALRGAALCAAAGRTFA